MKRKLLIIARDKLFVTSFTKALGDDYDVLHASDGVTGLEKVRSTTCDLLVIEAELPKCNGFILCRLIAFDSAYAHIPIIMFSDDSADKKTAMNVGAQAFYTKDTAFEELLNGLRGFGTI